MIQNVDDFLDLLIHTHDPNLADRGATGAMGVAHELFRHVTSLSVLWKQKAQLGPQQLGQVSSVLEQLRLWKPLEHLQQQADQSLHLQAPSREALIIMADLYRTACIILAIRLLEPSASAFHPMIRDCSQTGTRLLATVHSIAFAQSSSLIWPIVIIGVAATSDEDQDTCRAIVEALINERGLASFRTIVNLLSKAWETESDTKEVEPCGLNVLYDNDLLATVRT